MNHSYAYLQEMIDRKGEIVNAKLDQMRINRKKQEKIQERRFREVGHCLLIQCGDIEMSTLNNRGSIDKSKESRMGNTADNIDGIIRVSQICYAWGKKSEFLLKKLTDYKKEGKSQEESTHEW